MDSYISLFGNKTILFHSPCFDSAYIEAVGVIKSHCKFTMTILLIILIDNSLNSRIILTLFQVVVFIFFETKIFYFATKFLELITNLRQFFF